MVENTGVRSMNLATLAGAKPVQVHVLERKARPDRGRRRVSSDLPTPSEVMRALRDRYPNPERPPLTLRIVEILVTLVALTVTFPLMVLIAILIRLDSPGPALFRQKRVGQGGRLFTFIKFRTFWHDAPSRFPDLYAYDYTPKEVEELHFKVPRDPRATRVGRWLRQSTLDELPNFWNVLLGEVALVGPRPEIPEMLPYYSASELLKFSVRPGVTGFAQISGRGNLNFRDTLKCDLDYVRRQKEKGHCLFLDAFVILKTVGLILKRDGAF